MTETESLQKYGLRPASVNLPTIRERLAAQTQREGEAQGRGDTELMKLCCVQLFNAGELDDVLLIWRAKAASMDANGSIEIQLLCGRGLVRTKEFLSSHSSEEAQAALARLLDCEAAGDFEDFSVGDVSAFYVSYYDDSEQDY